MNRNGGISEIQSRHRKDTTETSGHRHRQGKNLISRLPGQKPLTNASISVGSRYSLETAEVRTYSLNFIRMI